MTILSKGQVIGNRYAIVNYHGAGGMQEVYLAQDQVLERHVALKTPKNDSAEKRFERSAILSAKVNHPNIAKTLDYFVDADRAYLIEEFIVGKDLSMWLKNDFLYLDPSLAAQFGHHVSKGLAASHHVEVIHRDLKPSNIMVEFTNGKFVFKVTDFGIAKLAESEIEDAAKGGEESITSSQTMMGAIPYMSPEMIRDVKNVTIKTDIWAFGAMLYRLITGEYPYGQGLPAVAVISEGNLPKQPSKFNSLIQYKWLVDELWDIILNCLQKDPAKRLSGDDLVARFTELAYGDYKRQESTIKSFGFSYGDFGFINGQGNDFFFHRNSFYGVSTMLKPSKRVLIGLPKGAGENRVHPVLPLK
jgi:eukaryotic-like serine/threonine-protein kinase